MTFASAEISTRDGRPAHCYRFSHGSSVWRHTSADSPISITDGTFTPEAIRDDRINKSREWDSGGLNVTVDRGHEVALLFQESRPREPVLLTVYSLNRGQSDVYPVRFSGTVAQAKFRDHSAQLVCLPTSYAFSRRIPYLRYSAKCPLALYGSRCGVNSEAFRERMIIGAVTGAVLQAAEAGSYPDGWFTNGYVQTLAGETRFVIDHTGDLLTLEYPLGVVASEAVDLFAGCDRTEATCESKFSNLPNHLGFAHIPSRDLFGKAVE